MSHRSNINFSEITFLHNLSNESLSHIAEVDYCTQQAFSCPQPHTAIVSYGIMRILFGIPGLILNTLFILTMIRNKSMRKTLTLVTFLSFGDLLISATSFSMGISDIIINERLFCVTKMSCYYLRPHMSFQICGVQLQCTSTLMVAIERFIAIMWPLRYYRAEKTQFLMCAGYAACVFTGCSYVLSIIVTSYQQPLSVYSDFCFIGRVAGKSYGNYIYIFSITLGSLAVVCYLIIFGFKLFKKLSRHENDNDKISVVRQNRERWLIKICCILTFSTFIFIVLPYLILYLGILYDIKCPKDNDILYLMRRFATVFLATNSFVGMSLSLVASRELRLAMLETLFCFKIFTRNGFESQSDELRKSSRQSNTRLSELDNISMKIVRSQLSAINSSDVKC